MLRFSRFFLAVLILVALMHLSQGETTTELPFFLERIKQTIKAGQAKVYNTVLHLSQGETTTELPFFLERIKQTIKVGQAKMYNTVLDLVTHTTTEMTTTTMEEDDFELTNRHLIVVPYRCPSGSDFIRGSCRTRVY